VKRVVSVIPARIPGTFSILERIDVGETEARALYDAALVTFSILERIDVGETLSIIH